MLEHWRKSQSWQQWRLGTSQERTFRDAEWPGKASQRSYSLNWAGKPGFSEGQWEGGPGEAEARLGGRRREDHDDGHGPQPEGGSGEWGRNGFEEISRQLFCPLKTSVASETSLVVQWNSMLTQSTMRNPPSHMWMAQSYTSAPWIPHFNTSWKSGRTSYIFEGPVNPFFGSTNLLEWLTELRNYWWLIYYKKIKIGNCPM